MRTLDDVVDAPLTELALSRAVFRLAWPAIGSMVLLNVFQLVDAFWVGRLGTDALGGLSTATFFVWCLHAVGLLAGTGINALVARRVGARDPAAAGRVAGHGLLLALTLGVVTAAGVLPFVDGLLGWLQMPAGIERAARAYLVPTLYGMPIITCTYAVESMFRGSGDTRTPMAVLGGTLLLNAVLDPAMIFGLGPIPALGIAGAAWATNIAYGVGVLIGLRIARRRSTRPRLGSFEPRLIGAVVAIGAPIAASSFLFCVIYIFLARIIADFGSAALAAVGVGHRIEGIAYFSAVGFATAAATLVGQHLGAGNPRQATRAAWLATGYCSALVAGASLAYFTLGGPIFSLFADDAAVVAHGREYLRIIALFEVAMAVEVVLEGAFSGAGYTLPPMLVSVPLTMARIPAAYLLAQVYGTRGIWWAISLSSAAKGMFMATWFALFRNTKSRV